MIFHGTNRIYRYRPDLDKCPNCGKPSILYTKNGKEHNSIFQLVDKPLAYFCDFCDKG